ncbi:MAG: hypothetical protein LBR35_00770 [Rickettsiales bacterium]|jgi:hypothetical protein|nr:hypothetical protein [Rickettsiales bacterium]
MQSAAAVVESGFNLVFTGKNKKDDKKALAKEREIMEKEAALEREKAAEQFRQEKERQDNLLKKALSSTRAKFGSNQIGNTSLSSLAVLQNLKDEADRTETDAKKLYNLEMDKIDQNLNKSLTSNLNKKRDVINSSNYSFFKEPLDLVKDLERINRNKDQQGGN